MVSVRLKGSSYMAVVREYGVARDGRMLVKLFDSQNNLFWIDADLVEVIIL